jgi:hypothetical protein
LRVSTNIEGTKQQVIQIQHKHNQNYKNKSLDQDKQGVRDETGNVNITSTSCKINIYYEMKNKKYHIVGTILKSNRIITETGNIDTPGIDILVMGIGNIFKIDDRYINIDR